MSTTTLYSASDLAKRLLPGIGFGAPMSYAISHVTAAIENCAQWQALNNRSSWIDLDAIVQDVGDMSMSWQIKDAIVSALRTKRNATFACVWALPVFRFGVSGYRLVVEAEVRTSWA